MYYSRIISSENAPKKIVQSLIDFVNMAKCLMDENQQPSVTQELGRLFPIMREREREKEREREREREREERRKQ